MAAPASYSLLSPDHHPVPSSRLHRSSSLPQQPLPEVPSPEFASRGGRRHWPSALSPNRPFLAPVQPTNRTLGTPRSLPCPPRPDSGDTSPEFAQPAPATAPRDYIAKKLFFPRAFPQKGNSNSEVISLILVNCIKNHRKIGKMQNQFCWIRCELSYNFCYSCLS
jgi:hypothetical protein